MEMMGAIRSSSISIHQVSNLLIEIGCAVNSSLSSRAVFVCSLNSFSFLKDNPYATASCRPERDSIDKSASFSAPIKVPQTSVDSEFLPSTARNYCVVYNA